jgi:hypothetical protein
VKPRRGRYVYAQSHPDEIRALLPAAIRNIRLATWSPLLDRVQLLKLAKYSKQYGVISTLPNFALLAPKFIEGGRSLQATVGTGSFVTLRLDGKKVEKLKPGEEAKRDVDGHVEEGRVPVLVRWQLETQGVVRSQLVAPGCGAGS